MEPNYTAVQSEPIQKMLKALAELVVLTGPCNNAA